METGNRNGSTSSQSTNESCNDHFSRRQLVSQNAESPKQEEWTTSKRVTNHTTRQVETRVKREIILENGKVISDSGPRIITKTTEDTTVEDNEVTEHKTDDFVNEKNDSRSTSYETKEETAEIEDDPWLQLPSDAYHHLAVNSTNLPRGRLTNYVSKSRKVTDSDVERSTFQRNDGEITTETTRVHHHEEVEDDEVPENDTNRITIPESSVETNRTYEWARDDDNFKSDSDDLIETTKTRAGGNVINIQMLTSRKPSPSYKKPNSPSLSYKKPTSRVIHVKGSDHNSVTFDKTVQVNIGEEPQTEDRQTQTPTRRKINEGPKLLKTKGHQENHRNAYQQNGFTHHRFVNAFDSYDETDYHISPPSTPPRMVIPYSRSRNCYNGYSSTPPGSSHSGGYRNSVTDDYRKWPSETRKWFSSDGTVVVEVRQPDRRHY